jgi:hypothetical protein
VAKVVSSHKRDKLVPFLYKQQCYPAMCKSRQKVCWFIDGDNCSILFMAVLLARTQPWPSTGIVTPRRIKALTEQTRRVEEELGENSAKGLMFCTVPRAELASLARAL